MKILVNAMSARMGGIVTYTANLMRSFLARGVDATFAVPPEFPAPAGCDAIHFRANRMHPLARLAWEQTAWRRLVARHAPDALFSSANFGILGCPVPQVLLVREGGLFDPFYLSNIAPSQGVKAFFMRGARRQLILASARASDAVFVPTTAMKDTLLSWAPDLTNKVESNHYGTLLEYFESDRHTRRWREDGQLKLLYVSEYYPHKRPGMVAEAVARLNEAGLPSRLTVTMDLEQIGRAEGGTADYRLLAKGVERQQVSLIGKVPYSTIPSLYQEHDLFVFPSVAETFGHPLIEALAIGLPVVSADRPVNREVCGDAAVYFEPFSLAGLVDRIKEVDAAEDLRDTLVRNGRERIAREFGWEGHVDRLLGMLDRVRRGRAPKAWRQRGICKPSD